MANPNKPPRTYEEKANVLGGLLAAVFGIMFLLVLWALWQQEKAEGVATHKNNIAITTSISIPKPVTHKPLSGRAGRPDLVRTSHTRPMWQEFVATWYDEQPGINGNGRGITATGAHVQDGWTVAVDPDLIPLGSIILVQFKDGSIHEYKADDTGGAIKGRRIDIFNSNPNQCMNNGRQPVLVLVAQRGNGQ